MSAASHDIVIEEGSVFDLYITEFETYCDKKDVTGYGAKFQVRKLRDPGSAVLYEASTANGRISVQPSGELGLFHIQLPIATVNTPAEPWETGYWDFVIWPGSGTINADAKRKVQGKARWSPAVTRP